MLKSIVFAALLPLSASAHAECEAIDATFEGERADVVLRVLSKAAGLELQNPDVASGSIDAVFEHEDACSLFPKVARGQGFKVVVEGRKAWLRPA